MLVWVHWLRLTVSRLTPFWFEKCPVIAADWPHLTAQGQQDSSTCSSSEQRLSLIQVYKAFHCFLWQTYIVSSMLFGFDRADPYLTKLWNITTHPSDSHLTRNNQTTTLEIRAFWWFNLMCVELFHIWMSWNQFFPDQSRLVLLFAKPVLQSAFN